MNFAEWITRLNALSDELESTDALIRESQQNPATDAPKEPPSQPLPSETSAGHPESAAPKATSRITPPPPAAGGQREPLRSARELGAPTELRSPRRACQDTLKPQLQAHPPSLKPSPIPVSSSPSSAQPHPQPAPPAHPSHPVTFSTSPPRRVTPRKGDCDRRFNPFRPAPAPSRTHPTQQPPAAVQRPSPRRENSSPLPVSASIWASQESETENPTALSPQKETEREREDERSRPVSPQQHPSRDTHRQTEGGEGSSSSTSPLRASFPSLSCMIERLEGQRQAAHADWAKAREAMAAFRTRRERQHNSLKQRIREVEQEFEKETASLAKERRREEQRRRDLKMQTRQVEGRIRKDQAERELEALPLPSGVPSSSSHYVLVVGPTEESEAPAVLSPLRQSEGPQADEKGEMEGEVEEKEEARLLNQVEEEKSEVEKLRQEAAALHLAKSRAKARLEGLDAALSVDLQLKEVERALKEAIARTKQKPPSRTEGQGASSSSSPAASFVESGEEGRVQELLCRLSVKTSEVRAAVRKLEEDFSSAEAAARRRSEQIRHVVQELGMTVRKENFLATRIERQEEKDKEKEREERGGAALEREKAKREAIVTELEGKLRTLEKKVLQLPPGSSHEGGEREALQLARSSGDDRGHRGTEGGRADLAVELQAVSEELRAQRAVLSDLMKRQLNGEMSGEVEKRGERGIGAEGGTPRHRRERMESAQLHRKKEKEAEEKIDALKHETIALSAVRELRIVELKKGRDELSKQLENLSRRRTQLEQHLAQIRKEKERQSWKEVSSLRRRQAELRAVVEREVEEEIARRLRRGDVDPPPLPVHSGRKAAPPSSCVTPASDSPPPGRESRGPLGRLQMQSQRERGAPAFGGSSERGRARSPESLEARKRRIEGRIRQERALLLADLIPLREALREAENAERGATCSVEEAQKRLEESERALREHQQSRRAQTQRRAAAQGTRILASSAQVPKGRERVRGGKGNSSLHSRRSPSRKRDRQSNGDGDRQETAETFVHSETVGLSVSAHSRGVALKDKEVTTVGGDADGDPQSRLERARREKERALSSCERRLFEVHQREKALQASFAPQREEAERALREHEKKTEALMVQQQKQLNKKEGELEEATRRLESLSKKLNRPPQQQQQPPSPYDQENKREEGGREQQATLDAERSRPKVNRKAPKQEPPSHPNWDAPSSATLHDENRAATFQAAAAAEEETPPVEISRSLAPVPSHTSQRSVARAAVAAAASLSVSIAAKVEEATQDATGRAHGVETSAAASETALANGKAPPDGARSLKRNGLSTPRGALPSRFGWNPSTKPPKPAPPISLLEKPASAYSPPPEASSFIPPPRIQLRTRSPSPSMPAAASRRPTVKPNTAIPSETHTASAGKGRETSAPRFQHSARRHPPHLTALAEAPAVSAGPSVSRERVTLKTGDQAKETGVQRPEKAVDSSLSGILQESRPAVAPVVSPPVGMEVEGGTCGRSPSISRREVQRGSSDRKARGRSAGSRSATASPEKRARTGRDDMGARGDLVGPLLMRQRMMAAGAGRFSESGRPRSPSPPPGFSTFFEAVRPLLDPKGLSVYRKLPRLPSTQRGMPSVAPSTESVCPLPQSPFPSRYPTPPPLSARRDPSQRVPFNSTGRSLLDRVPSSVQPLCEWIQTFAGGKPDSETGWLPRSIHLSSDLQRLEVKRWREKGRVTGDAEAVCVGPSSAVSAMGNGNEGGSRGPSPRPPSPPPSLIVETFLRVDTINAVHIPQPTMDALKNARTGGATRGQKTAGEGGGEAPGDAATGGGDLRPEGRGPSQAPSLVQVDGGAAGRQEAGEGVRVCGDSVAALQGCRMELRILGENQDPLVLSVPSLADFLRLSRALRVLLRAKDPRTRERQQRSVSVSRLRGGDEKDTGIHLPESRAISPGSRKAAFCTDGDHPPHSSSRQPPGISMPSLCGGTRPECVLESRTVTSALGLHVCPHSDLLVFANYIVNRNSHT
uniref:Uncharacterized protein n=1 Tax=Chromera velia CCMP2878 TaxID=1169474 RepID=A0A0G4F8Y2_9ALVE|eukprot:Cvel_2987.t1-p1 / transcript=Cvel_2987.t1 / gene=Cvel_2987 / organism=Chromera_velia_CCMP2878 / gene_product=Splicing factor, proline- and glutamine-rich, putative / transcript_product=Splicing factor, proline- and glutamine-rich, putative / location=Cvel_scaffold118:118735-128138(+) / protein_length=1991 / sequence_SO=supercontig / SO=protein_coding / is_pseudo=false